MNWAPCGVGLYDVWEMTDVTCGFQYDYMLGYHGN